MSSSHLPELTLVSYMTLEEATAAPTEGFWYVLTDRWWSYEPEKGIIFYRKFPQCNRSKNIAEMITKKCWPGAEIIFLDHVYVQHDCKDYY